MRMALRERSQKIANPCAMFTAPDYSQGTLYRYPPASPSNPAAPSTSMETVLVARFPRALLLLLLLVVVCAAADARAVDVYSRSARFPASGASGELRNERFSLQGAEEARSSWVRGCPCHAWHEEPKASRLCLPVAVSRAESVAAKKKEVFAFSIASDDRWKHYDWDLLTTVAWNTDKEMLCHAHDKGVLVVVKHNFDDVDQLCDLKARQDWIEATYELIATNYADGVNIDTEKPMNGKTAQCLGELVRELRSELERHPMTKNAQISFDVPWAPRGVDGRYYPWRALADAADLLFVMSYDMRSQIYDACVAGANSPRALVQQGIDEYLLGFGIPADKLVLGVPWYGYKYECEAGAASAPSHEESAAFGGGVCSIPAVPFFGAPCSDAAGKQLDFAVIQEFIRARKLSREWDEITESPFVWFNNGLGAGSSSPQPRTQIWFDDPESLAHKFQIVHASGLRGAGMWHIDALNYSAVAGTPAFNDTQRMWQALRGAITPLGTK